MFQEMIVAACAAGAVAASATGDIESNDPEDGAHFGSSIALNGFTYAIGAPGHSGGGRVEVRSNINSLHDVLGNPSINAHAEDHFGAAVALGDAVCVVGSPGLDDIGTNTGGAWVFNRTIAGWQLGQQLHRDGMDANEDFGTAVALDASRIYVGAPGAFWNGSDEGKVYVYERRANGNGWELRRELYSGEINTSFFGNRFGSSLASDGRTLAVGAPGMSPAGFFVFGAGDISQLPGAVVPSWRPTLVEAPSGGGSSDFGTSIAVEGGLLVVGAPDWNNGSGRGAIFIYKKSLDVWQLQASFHAESYGRFGASVSITDGVIVAGEPDAQDGGRIHVYLQSGGEWIEQSPEFSALESGEGMGSAVALGGGLFYAGSPHAGGGIVRVGPYMDCIDCNANGICDSTELESSLELDCNLDGILDACQFLLDCNDNGVPDECEGLIELPRVLPADPPTPVELLLLEDTSGSTNPDRAAVCSVINDAISEINDQVGIQITVNWTRIATTSPGAMCVEGEEFPIPAGSPVPNCNFSEPRFVDTTEDWGDAISFAASNFPWSNDGLRFILVMTDEGPSFGDSGQDCGEDDVASLIPATQLAATYGVQLFPVPLPGTSSCLYGISQSMMETLAQDGYGSVLDARDLNQFDTVDVVGPLLAAIDDSPYVIDAEPCPGDVDLNGIVDANDLLVVISDWGLSDSPADLNGDEIVDASDLLEVIAGWGVCG